VAAVPLARPRARASPELAALQAAFATAPDER